MTAALINVARAWLGTPWRHQGRRKGVGVDCVGFVAEVGREAGLLDVADAANYRRRPTDDTLRRRLTEVLAAIPVADIAPGDVVLMRFDGVESHVGLIADYAPIPGELSLIHAYLPARKVVEHRIDDAWRARMVAAFRIRQEGGT